MRNEPVWWLRCTWPPHIEKKAFLPSALACAIRWLKRPERRKAQPQGNTVACMTFGGCAALIHPTKAKPAVARWMRCAYPPYESQTRRCSVDALRLSTLRKPNPPLFGGCAALIHPTKAESAAVRWMRCAYPPYESQTPLFGGCAALIHPTKAESAAVRWMRCAYPPYESRIRRCSVDALRLSTLRKPNPPLFGGCAALIHATKARFAAVRWMRCAYPPYEARFAAVRWMRCAYPPYESRIRCCSVDALRLSTLRKPNPPLFGGCAALIHPTKVESATVRWMRCAYPPYESPIRRCSVDALRLSTLRKPNPPLFGGCAALIHPTKPDSLL
jgi:hypothetical protein